MLENSKFHHIGYAVHDIEKTARVYLEEGWSLSISLEDPIQNVIIAFLRKNEMPLIELVAPRNELSPICKTLEKLGVTPYHICYEVDNIYDAIKYLRKKKFIPLFAPVEAIAIDNRKICYLYHPDTGLVELLQ